MKCECCGKSNADYRASVVKTNNGTGQRFELCKECAMCVSFAMQAYVKAIREGAES